MKALALALLLGAAVAQDVPDPGREREVESAATAEVRRAAERLERDPAAAEALTERIMRSRVRRRLGAEDPERISAWVRKSPASAAHLAVGFAQDDARGDDSFERSLDTRLERLFQLNPGRYRGLFGRLSGMSLESRRIGLERPDEEDSREALKRLFEGRQSSEGKVRARTEVRAEASYDRLSAGNLGGRSPDVLAYQNAMNQRRAPGAPRLVETGRLDHATLRYPYYGLRYDLDRLKRAAGDVPAASRRGLALAGAEAAIADFDAEAGRAAAPGGITRERIQRLSRLRRRAARWIAAASVSELEAGLAARVGCPERLRARMETALAEASAVSARLAEDSAEDDPSLERRVRLLRAEARALHAAIDAAGRPPESAAPAKRRSWLELLGCG